MCTLVLHLYGSQAAFTGAGLLVVEPPEAVHASQEEPVTDAGGLGLPGGAPRR